MSDHVDLLVRNAALVTPSDRRLVDIAMREGRFVSIGPPGTGAIDAPEVVDASGLVALPGVIDGHVHFRSPGLEHEEDWLSGSRAATFGGVTTVLDMPNTIPPTDTVERAREKLALAGRSAYCDFGLFGLLGNSQQSIRDLVDSHAVIGLKAFLGPTTGGLSAPGEASLRQAMHAAAASGIRVAFHAEDRQIVQRAEQQARLPGRSDLEAHLESRPIEAEVVAIEEVGRLASETDCLAHVLHVSSSHGLEAVARWRAKNVDLTCEATPHHALLDRDVHERFGNLAKVNPPIRGKPHASALLAALADGRIDVIGSDHAPHLEADKRRDSIWDVPAGIPGVETLLPLMLTEVAEGRLSLKRLVHATSEMPARIWGLWPRKGAVELGSDADLTLVDLDQAGTIRAFELHGKNNATPFEGVPTRGAVVATIVRGRIVMREGELLAPPGWGRPVSRL